MTASPPAPPARSFFQTEDWNGIPGQWWFGGGTDITPSWVVEVRPPPLPREPHPPRPALAAPLSPLAPAACVLSLGQRPLALSADP